MNKKITSFFIIFSIFNFAITLLSCGSNSESDEKYACIDGSNIHELVFHEKVEYEEEYGNEEYYSCNKCQKIFDANKNVIDYIPKTNPKRKIILTNKKNGASESVINLKAKNYLSLTDENDIAAFLYSCSVDNSSNPIYFPFKTNGATAPYKLELSLNDSFDEICFSMRTTSSTFVAYNIIPATYYYRIVDAYGNTSLVDSFKISDTLRPIYKAGCVSNMRDIGGWPSLNGDKVKYGMLYRCALPSENDADLFNSLKIKTQLDLRRTAEIGSYNGVSKDIKYEVALDSGANIWPQYDLIFSFNNKIAISQYFKKVFDLLSEKSNYPLVFHCKSGADRTGTLAYIINGLCGVGYEQLTKDFELTSIYYKSRWRSNIIFNNNVYSFDESGKMLTEDNVHWAYFHSQMINQFGDETNLLSKAILNFLVNYCNVDIDKIQKTLSIIVDGTGYMSLFE